MHPQYTPIPSLTPAEVARFWAKVDRSGGPGACWPWRGKPNRKGYGRFGLRRRVYIAHRIAYTIAVAPPPLDRAVCHVCDTPSCCNPAHHFLGTVAENNQDMWRKGRGKITHRVSRTTFSREFFAEHGHPRAKLTRAQVIEVRSLRQQGWKLKDLAARYGISVTQASKVARGLTYGRVEP